MGCNDQQHPRDERSLGGLFRREIAHARSRGNDGRFHESTNEERRPLGRRSFRSRSHPVLDGLDPLNLRDLFLQHSLDAISERQLRHRAATARALQRYLDYTVLRNVNEFDIAAIGLKSRTDLIECCLYAFFHGKLLPRIASSR